MESFTNILSITVAIASAVGLSVSLWRMFRMPKTLTVTRKDTGKSVVINMRGTWREGAKLTTLL